MPKLHKYQIEAAQQLYSRPLSGLFCDPGGGKTLIILSVLRKVKARSGKLRALIIAPMRVCRYVWPQEIQKWDARISAHFLHGRGKTAQHSGAEIELINPEGLRWLAESRGGQQCWDALIVDESSQFKNGRSIRFRILQKMLSTFSFHRVHILTGTPAPRGYLDLWSQIYLLDRGNSLGRYITHYRKKYFIENRRRDFSTWELRSGADDEINAKIKPLVHRVDRIELGAKMRHNRIPIHLPRDAIAAYRSMWKTLVAEIKGKKIWTKTAATKYQACCQIAGGMIYDADGSTIAVHGAKITALRELIGELHGAPLLLGYRYRHEGDRIRVALQCPVIGGGLDKEDESEILQKWNSGELPVLAAQPQTISHGLNLQGGGCADVCWYSLTDDYDRYAQFVRRVYRQGMSGDVCMVHFLEAVGTLDALIYQRLHDRAARQKSLLEFLSSAKGGAE